MSSYLSAAVCRCFLLNDLACFSFRSAAAIVEARGIFAAALTTPQQSGSAREEYTIPRIGSIKLTKLTSRDLQKLYKELMENGRIARKSGHGNPGLSSTTVCSLHLMLHSAFERAVRERLILRNPTEDCIAPKVQKIEMQILPPEHIKDYLEAADRRGLLPMFYLESVTGLRKGEITALLWSDLDTKDKTISVSKQYVKNPNGELTLSRPKTETSVRATPHKKCQERQDVI